MTVPRRDALAVLALLAALVLLAAPELGSDPWTFDVEAPEHAGGLLGPLVRAAGGEWDLGIVRAPALLAGLTVVVAGIAGARARRWRGDLLGALAAVVVALLLVPAVLLQVGLRDATVPWAHTNDSTYQIEIAGDLVLDGDDPYGHDYRGTGLERWYDTVRETTDRGGAALDHFAYFPGTVLSAAAWRVLPAPLDDYRLFVLLASLALFPAALLFRAVPLPVRIAAGALLAASPLVLRAAWFGTADAPSVLLVVLAFALLTRGRPTGGAAALAGAVLLKQFALVALPFFAVALLLLGTQRATLRRAAVVFAAIVAAGFLPFALAGPGALWDDTIAYGAGTYRIIGYGLAGLLVEAGIVDRRGSYPFAPLALLVWLPATAWLALAEYRARSLAGAGAGFAASAFLLFWLGRVFQQSYLVWPFAGLVLAGLLVFFERGRERSSSA